MCQGREECLRRIHFQSPTAQVCEARVSQLCKHFGQSLVVHFPGGEPISNRKILWRKVIDQDNTTGKLRRESPLSVFQIVQVSLCDRQTSCSLGLRPTLFLAC